jgi:hypothetical protein
MVPTTITKITANITAYSAISWPWSSRQSLKMRSVMEIPPHEFFCTAGALVLGGEPDQTIANRTTDFNPDWIRMILLLVSGLVKLRRQLCPKGLLNKERFGLNPRWRFVETTEHSKSERTKCPALSCSSRAIRRRSSSCIVNHQSIFEFSGTKKECYLPCASANRLRP